MTHPPRNPRNNPLYQSHDFLGAGNGNLFHGSDV